MSEVDAVYVLVMSYPFLVLALVLFVMWLTAWHERREDRRRPPRIVHLDSTVG
jgi:hypothetical protein